MVPELSFGDASLFRNGASVNNMPWDKPWPDPQHTPWKQWSDSEKATYAKEWDLTIEEAEAY
jgi:hypothetical protein